MPYQDFLIVEWELVDYAGFQRRLGAAEHAGVLQGELLQHHSGHFMLDTLTHAAGRVEGGVRLESVCVVRCRPVPVQQVPAAVDEDFQVGEDLEIADAPRLDAAGVEPGGQLTDVGSTPWPDKSAAGC